VATLRCRFAKIGKVMKKRIIRHAFTAIILAAIAFQVCSLNFLKLNQRKNNELQKQTVDSQPKKGRIREQRTSFENQIM